jgi:RNA polymerase sigma-70 factor, ECF subfamily
MTALPLQPLSSLDLWDSTQRVAALRLVRRIVKDADESEDVVQDVFFRVSQMEGAALLLSNRAWMTRVLVNSSINALRGRKRRLSLQLMPSWLPCPETHTGHKQMLAQVLRAMQMLSPQHQRLLRLRDFEGLSYPQMAARLGVPEGTVKSGLSRARAGLSQALQGVLHSRGEVAVFEGGGW